MFNIFPPTIYKKWALFVCPGGNNLKTKDSKNIGIYNKRTFFLYIYDTIKPISKYEKTFDHRGPGTSLLPFHGL